MLLFFQVPFRGRDGLLCYKEQRHPAVPGADHHRPAGKRTGSALRSQASMVERHLPQQCGGEQESAKEKS